MNTYREIQLGGRANAYIREYLARGNTLAMHLLQQQDLGQGEVTTYLPSDISIEEAMRFTTGGKIQVLTRSAHFLEGSDGSMWKVDPIPNTDSYLADVIQAFLEETQDRVCIFEDATSKPNDPVLSPSDERILVLQEEVYYVLFGRSASEEVIRQTIRDANSIWHFVCAMISFQSSEMSFCERRQITSHELQVLAKGTEKLVVGAYDGEGYLVWSRG